MGNGSNRIFNNRSKKPVLKEKDRVLMTFQVDRKLRTAANEKADQTAINISAFLRQCVYEFTQSTEIEKVTSQLQKSVTQNALTTSSLTTPSE